LGLPRSRWINWSIWIARFGNQVLQREIEGQASEFVAVGKRCAVWNPRFGKVLETRYHRLLLRILEWTFHLEALAKKPKEFWVGRRSAVSSPESDEVLPSKHRRLNSSVGHIAHNDHQVDEMRQSSMMEGMTLLSMSSTSSTTTSSSTTSSSSSSSSPPLLLLTGVSTANISIYEFKHADTDTDDPDPCSDEGRQRKGSSLMRSNDTSENEWTYSSNALGPPMVMTLITSN